MNGEAHVGDITYLTTLAGYVHWQLTGEKVMGIGEASGMFPIDSEKMDFDQGMVEQYDALTAEREYRGTRRHVARAHSHRIGSRHAGACVALRRAEGDAGAQRPGGVQQPRFFWRSWARRWDRGPFWTPSSTPPSAATRTAFCPAKIRLSRYSSRLCPGVRWTA